MIVCVTSFLYIQRHYPEAVAFCVAYFQLLVEGVRDAEKDFQLETATAHNKRYSYLSIGYSIVGLSPEKSFAQSTT